jgi:hypothetical protein
MIHVPLDPYWGNAIQHWIASRSDTPMTERNIEIDLWWQWLEDQGVVVIRTVRFKHYLEFTDDRMATAFMLRWL